MLPLKAEFTKSYEDFYYESIEEYVKRPLTLHRLTLLDKAVGRYFNPHIKCYKELILASPETLEILVQCYLSKPSYIRSIINITLSMTTLYSAFSNGSFKKHSNGDLLDSESHFRKLDFENCPYCNENKIVSWKKTKGGIRRSYDWDHFIPQKAFPFLAISLYNLVPSCKVCNFLKLDSKIVGLNPYLSYSIDNLLTFSINADNLKYFESSDSFEIKKIIPSTIHGEKLKLLLETIYLEERYSETKQMLRFVFRKYRAYSRSYLILLARSYGILSESKKKEFFELFFNVYTSEEEYKHMPYSKLISDSLYKKNTH